LSIARPWLGYHRISRIGGRVDTPVSDGEFRQKVTGFADRKGFDLELLPVEKDQTGSKFERPILEEAIRRIESGEAAGLIVVRYNRLSRATASDTHLIIERVENGAGGRVHSVEEDYPDTPEGRMARGMAFNVSRMEWERSQLQVRASKIGAVEAGVWPMSVVPVGYNCVRRKDGGDGKLKVDPPAKRKVLRAFRARRDGRSWTAVGLLLGVGPTGAQKVIRNRVYLGEINLKVDGELVRNPAAHEPIVGRELWEAAQVEHPRPPRNPDIGPSLLRGLVRCAGCGGAMSPDSSKGERRYRCVAHNKTGGRRCESPAIISRDKLDEHVERVALAEIDRLSFSFAERNAEVPRAETAVEDAKAEIQEFQRIMKASERPEFFAEGMKDRIAALERAELESRRARQVVGSVPPPGTLRELWPDLSVEERGHVLRGSLGAVYVRKGRGPADGRVRIFAPGFEPPSLREGRDVGPLPWDDDLDGVIGVASGEQLA
jgi:DNA invertase Pin-like site-specific DNA recombinase